MNNQEMNQQDMVREMIRINKSGTNAFIYNRDSGDLRLGSNNQSSMVSIKSTGNVGIGTNSPTVNLQVYDASSSQIKITNGLATPVDLQLFASSSSYAGIGTASNHRLAFRTNNTEKVTILTNGNLGIGTSSPTQLLDVTGADAEIVINMVSKKSIKGISKSVVQEAYPGLIQKG